jgi:hypothetical protein
MKKILEKKVEHIYVILALFVIVVGGLFYFQVKSEKKLTDVKQLLKITIVEAIDHGVDADSLKEKYVENDSLNNGRR